MYYGYDDPSAAANGTGRYFGKDDPQAATNGFGAYFTQAPEQLPMSGLGCSGLGCMYSDDSDAMQAGAFLTLWGAGRVVGGLAVGAALAPAGSKGIWMLAGGILGSIGGPIGLGALALMAMKGARS